MDEEKLKEETLRDNHELVGRALNRKLRDILVPFVAQQLSTFYRTDWWKRGVLDQLSFEQRRKLPREGNYNIFTDSMDLQLCFEVIASQWRDVFRYKLKEKYRSWVSELRTLRNNWAHTNYDEFTDSDTERALDTMARFTENIDAEVSHELWNELMAFRRRRYEAVAASSEELSEDAKLFYHEAGELPSWREIMQPNPDIQDGTYKTAEFAADLAQVAAGTSKLVEYQDATEFFSRTYLTIGLRRLLIEALNRLVLGNGDPIIEVKTSFGGGKTHSMMALYHLFNRKYRLTSVDESVQEIFRETRLASLPEDIRIAVAVGTDLNTEREKEIPELDGVKIRTLMGEVCAQLARAAENFELYEKHIRLNDERGVSPGVKDLREFLDGCGACLILMDELVAYGKKLYGGGGGKNFDAFIVFLQELSEAVRTSSRSMLVVSLPQSDIEIGIGDGGREVLRTIEHHFGRLQSIWNPVEAQESFEIVRRRLFMTCRDEAARDEICNAFSAFYRRKTKKVSFPSEVQGLNYLKRMKSCYPIHPQLFDMLYGKWATIENFQKTRGVLRFMAAVIHELWKYGDEHSMIMPSSIPLNEQSIRAELVKYLPSNWDAIVKNEIDGDESRAFKLETTAKHIRLQTARRLTRTIFLGSAPSTRSQAARGLEMSEIMLGILLPHEKGEVETFKLMLETLKSQLLYLYSNETRTWFDGRPTLRKVAEELEREIEDWQVDEEVTKRVLSLPYKGRFRKRYLASKPEEVPDKDEVCLVIVPPSEPYDHKIIAEFQLMNAPLKYDESKITDFDRMLEKIVRFTRFGKDEHDTSPRVNKNMLLFIAFDKSGVEPLYKMQRSLMAWEKLRTQKEERNLDQVQLAEIDANIDGESGLKYRLDMQVTNILTHGMVPSINPDEQKRLLWTDIPLKQGEIGKLRNLEMFADRLDSENIIIRQLAPEPMMNMLERYPLKEKNHESLTNLWEFYTNHLYASRLYDIRVLERAVCAGVREGKFALADAFDEKTKQYEGLVFERSVSIEAYDQLLVKRAVAIEQLDAKRALEEKLEAQRKREEAAKAEEVEEVEEPLPTRFELESELDVENPIKDMKKLIEEIVESANWLEGAEVSLELTIKIRVPDGIPEDVQNALRLNGKNLGVKSIYFAR